MSTITTSLYDSYRQNPKQRAGVSSTEVWGPRFVLLILLIWAAAFAIGFQSALGILTAMGFAAAIFGLRWPFIGLLGVSMLCTLDSFTRVYLMSGGLLRWNTFNYWLCIVTILGAPLLIRRNDPHSRLLQVFILLLAIETTFSPNMMSGVLHIMNIAAAFGLLVYFLRIARDNCAWYWLGMVNGILAAVGGLVYYVQHHNLPYIDPNAMCYFSLTAIFSICLSIRFAKTNRFRLYALVILAAINFCWIFLAGSRGGILIALFCLCVLALVIRGMGNRIVLFASASCLALAIVVQFPDIQQHSARRVQKLFDSSRSLMERTSNRSSLAVGAWRIFLDHPLGVGTGGYSYYWARLDNRAGLSGAGQGKATAAHAAWLKSLVENGVPGFAILVIYVFSFAWVGWNKRNQGLLAIGLLATGALSTAFITSEFAGKALWFLAAGVTALLHREALIATPQRKIRTLDNL